MNLLDLMIKIAVDDRASGEIDSIANEATGKFGGMASKIGGAAKAIGTTMVAVTGAAVAGATAIGKAAFDGYSQYEQLAGGISKLFGDASKDVMRNAQEAYKTSGMSANQYMEQVSGFAAALTNSLGGDTVKAAKQADVAMRAISDNVNTFGTDMQSVQYAFQGFAKQNYTMLDNLKLGYGGTKSEMERLIADANEYAASIGQASNLSIDSFSDIVTAIDLVQQKQNIAGTTAREAATTIEGSVNMAKSAWSNWVTELGKDNADMEARTQELVDSLVTAAGNIVPRITTIASTLIRTLPTAISKLGSSLLPAVVELGGSLLAAVGDIVTELVTNVLPTAFAQIGELVANIDLSVAIEELRIKLQEGLATLYDWIQGGGAAMFDLSGIVLQKVQEVSTQIMESMPSIIDSIGEVLLAIGQTVVDNGPEFLSQLGDFFANFLKSIGDNAPRWLDAFSAKLKELIDLVIEHGPEILRAAADFFGQVLKALVENAPKILSALLSTIVDLIGYIVTHIPQILSAALEFFGSILSALLDAIPKILEGLGGLVLDAINAIVGAVGDMLNAGLEFVGGLLDGAAQKGEEVLDWFANLPWNILNALGDLGSWLLNTGGDLIGGLWDGATQVFRDVRDWFVNLPNRIVNAVGNLGSLLETQGHNVLTGFWNGMIGVWNDLTGWIGGIGNWIAEHKGPKEYDLKLLVKNGGWIMEGLEEGLRDGFPMIEKTVDDIGQMISSRKFEVTSGIGNIGTEAMSSRAGVMASKGGNQLNIHIDKMEVREERDIYRVSNELNNIWAREMEGRLV